MKYELGDHAYVRCPETGMSADIEFKSKGYFSGTYNAIGGFIKDAQGKNLYEFSGLWNEEMYIKDLTVSTWPIRAAAISKLTWTARLERRNSSSTRLTHDTPRQLLARWRSRMSASLSGCGMTFAKPLNNAIRTSPPTQRER